MELSNKNKQELLAMTVGCGSYNGCRKLAEELSNWAFKHHLKRVFDPFVAGLEGEALAEACTHNRDTAFNKMALKTVYSIFKAIEDEPKVRYNKFMKWRKDNAN